MPSFYLTSHMAWRYGELHLNRVMVLQKKITHIICFKSYNYHTAPLFYDLTILDVYKLYRLLIATFVHVHDLINNKLPHNFIDYFTYVSHHYETRAKGNYKISLIDIRTNLGKQTVSFSGAQIWNTMPKELRNVISRKKFKQIFKKDLLEGYNILWAIIMNISPSFIGLCNTCIVSYYCTKLLLIF